MAPGHAERAGPRRFVPGVFALALILSGVLSGLLTLLGATLIEETSATDQEPWPGCAALQVGSLHAGTTHIFLENGGPDSSHIRLDWIDDYGALRVPVIDFSQRLEPWASADIQFRAPALGAVVQVSSSVTNLHARAEVRRNDRGATENRSAFLCPGG